MFHAGVVLVAVAAGGVGLAFAAVALARGAEALGGFGERERDEQRQRRDRGQERPLKWGRDGLERARNEKGHALRVLGEVARGLDGGWNAGWRGRDL